MRAVVEASSQVAARELLRRDERGPVAPGDGVLPLGGVRAVEVERGARVLGLRRGQQGADDAESRGGRRTGHTRPWSWMRRIMSLQVSVASPTSCVACSALRKGWYSPTSRVLTAGCGIPRTNIRKGQVSRSLLYSRGRRLTREVEP